MEGLIQGCNIKQEAALLKAATEPRTLRGGNSACLVGGDIVGRCGREAVMRYFGIDKVFDFRKKLMFDAGEMVEASLVDWLGYSWEGQIKRQKDAATSWKTKSGVEVTGSPDILLCTADGTPVHGLETKNASSVWTATKVAPFGKYRDGRPEPKMDAVCQAAHYSMALGFIPWSIVYISTNNWSIAPTQKALREFQGFPQYFDRRDGVNVNILPFLSVFNLEWDSNKRVSLVHEETGHTIQTPVTADGIVGYYELLAECIEKRKLPPRSKTVDAYGKKEQGWTLYDKQYNDYHDLHNKYDNGRLTFDEFLAEARIIATNGSL
jgi:hypothetical protein